MRSISSVLNQESQHGEADLIHILAVDDKLENLIVYEAIFQKSGYHLVTATSGADALAKFNERDFAVVLLDVQMPGMDGFETANSIRRLETSKRTPIIFVTAIHKNEMSEQKGYVSGAVDFLFKPINPTILRSKVEVFADLFKSKLEIQRQSRIINEKVLQEQENEFVKRALESRDRFLSVASHELNTPITPLSLQMQSFLKMIRNGTLKTMESERLERMLVNASGQVERLSRIINELVDVTQISSEKMSLLKEKDVSLLDVAESVLESFAEDIKQLGYRVSLDAHTDPVGVWDRMRLEQVLVNLLSNALKYGLGKPIVISIDQFGDVARLCVKDQGIGIAKEDQQRIFERFERAVSDQNYGGLGLGLFISQEIVRLHGGRINVKSGLELGSEFSVEIPLTAL